MKKVLLLIFLILSFSIESFAQFELNNEDSVKVNKIISLLESEAVKFHVSIDEIPEGILKWIKRDVEDFTLADFNEEFNRTDLIDGEQTMRRINLIASSGDFWIISYAHGGVGLHRHISLFEMNGKVVVDSWSAATMQDANDLETIRKVLEDKKLISHRYTDKY